MEGAWAKGFAESGGGAHDTVVEKVTDVYL